MPYGTTWTVTLVALVGFVCWGLIASSAVAQTGTTPTEADLAAGKKLYEERCMHCHGEAGDGQGPATEYVYPKPRDFTSGTYKFRTRHETEDGNRLPSDEDIFRSIAQGLHGSSMPDWESFFTKQKIWQLVHYIKTFSDLFEEDKPGLELDFSGAIPSSPESIAKGKQYFEEDFDCDSCHGTAGRGNGKQALEGLEDDWGSRIWPANLTRPWTYRGGHTRQDIFRNISLGINGTPMPAFADPDPMIEVKETDDPEEKKELEADARELREGIWHVVNYVQSLWTQADEPEPKSVLTAHRVKGPLPQSPDDPAWKAVSSNYYPLVGQVVEAPRLFAPMVVGIEVQALHNDQEIAFRLVWDDRTPSKPGEREDIETYVDAVALQFPSHPKSGMERPYFLMGDAEHPTDLWYWRSNSATAVRVQTTGYKTFEPGEDTGGVQSQGQFDNGQYRLLMTRPLHTETPDKEMQFEIGAFLPFSTTVWDGSNGEHGGGKRTVSAWYNLYLEPEPSRAPLYLLFVGIVVGLVVEFSALYVTRKNHANDNTVSE
ncbi:MAG: ethylbenzene dehydrogenase-related protein [Candidatus Tectomicrobia bacterium]